MVLDIAILHINFAPYYHFPFAFFVFALGSYLTLAVAVIHMIDTILRIRSSLCDDTARQPQGEHAPQNDIPRNL